jgi:hypothetical protein
MQRQRQQPRHVERVSSTAVVLDCASSCVSGYLLHSVKFTSHAPALTMNFP